MRCQNWDQYSFIGNYKGSQIIHKSTKKPVGKKKKRAKNAGGLEIGYWLLGKEVDWGLEIGYWRLVVRNGILGIRGL
ncbi:MAG: hypothetical protein GY757_52235 [bacterium]|nr:hypothetical protein [bacterium]